MKKELIIVSGFLGSGKTTFLGLLLKKFSHKKIAVLLNDFGEMPVDATLLDLSDLEHCEGKDKLIELGGGSVFCSCLKESFIKALIALAATDAELVIIEASGMSDPASMNSLLWLAKLGDTFAKPSVLCLFDPIKSLKLSKVLEVIPRQIRASDVAILTKTDICSHDELQAAYDYVNRIKESIPIYEHGHVGNYEALTCLDSNGVLVDQSTAETSHLFGFNTPETRPDSFIINTAPLGINALLESLETTDAILRVKGYLQNEEQHLYITDTGKGFSVQESKNSPVPLTVICMQGAGSAIQQHLIQNNLIA